MINRFEKPSGIEIVCASAEVTKKQYTEDAKYSEKRFSRYLAGLRQADMIIAPSTLTANTVAQDFGDRRLLASVHASMSLPFETVDYIQQSADMVGRLMGTIVAMRVISGMNQPEGMSAFFQQKVNTDQETFEGFLEFIDPVLTQLKKGVADNELLGLLGISAAFYADHPSFINNTPEAVGVTMGLYQSIYPRAVEYLSRKSKTSAIEF